MLQYSSCVPTQDVQADDESRLHRTAVGQLLAFTLQALAAEASSQEWHDTAHGDLSTWELIRHAPPFGTKNSHAADASVVWMCKMNMNVPRTCQSFARKMRVDAGRCDYCKTQRNECLKIPDAAKYNAECALGALKRYHRDGAKLDLGIFQHQLKKADEIMRQLSPAKRSCGSGKVTGKNLAVEIPKKKDDKSGEKTPRKKGVDQSTTNRQPGLRELRERLLGFKVIVVVEYKCLRDQGLERNHSQVVGE
ncbi:hypothetical protein PHISCL_03059 [Aspergillus sclerotialis]|uniref:Uncharacterized protein n=1 Tax=Aspergillus sclerotialis TaxID=2070753 RepID=A0A3A3A5E9_9EURO|nr:hypothetical protein PHISCL_03059 [Aspergillus sclerotialis]